MKHIFWNGTCTLNSHFLISFFCFAVKNGSAGIYLLKVNKVWNMFKSNNKVTVTTPLVSFSCFYCVNFEHFTPCSSIFIVNFGHVNAGWGQETGYKKLTFWRLFLHILRRTIAWFPFYNYIFYTGIEG